jgi:putative transposase
VIETIHQGLKQDGFDVAVSKICQWFDIPRLTAYYKPMKAAPKIQEQFAEPIRKMILEEPSFGYRTVAPL